MQASENLHKSRSKNLLHYSTRTEDDDTGSRAPFAAFLSLSLRVETLFDLENELEVWIVRPG